MNAKRNEADYSNTLMKVIEANRLGCLSDMPALSERDVADLKEILKGTKTTREPVDTKQAIAILAHAEPSVESGEILGKILANTRESTRVRVAAAANLGKLGKDAAEEALLDNLDTDDPFVRAEVIKSLAKSGSAESLRRLDHLPKSASDQERKLAEFAKTAIAFREGKKDQEMMPHAKWKSRELKMIEGDRVAKVAGKIWGSTYGVVLSREVGFHVVCGKVPLNILLNGELKRGSWLKTLRSKPMIAGIMVSHEAEVEHYSVRNVLLTKPTETGFEITTAKTNGDVVLAGKAEPEGNGFRLMLRDVGTIRTPTEIRGMVTEDSVQLNLHTWSGDARRKKHGEPVEM